MTYSTPIAFLIFNRPSLTQIVFEEIAKIKPQKLLIVADGPRFPEEEEKCQQARSVIMDNINWDCDVLTNFSNVNLGCGERVCSGLDWVFSEVEEAIILEDDCLPSLSFFSFCENLLDRYRFDQRVMLISGTSFSKPPDYFPYSYYFSKYGCIWGWASWKRAWQYYDKQMKLWESFKNTNMMANIFNNPDEQKYWFNVFQNMINNPIDTWDIQWFFNRLSQGGLSIFPTVNLVSNIGFDANATHTSNKNHLSDLLREEISTIVHPKFLLPLHEVDKYLFDYVYDGFKLKNKSLKQKSNIKIIKDKIAKKMTTLFT